MKSTSVILANHQTKAPAIMYDLDGVFVNDLTGHSDWETLHSMRSEFPAALFKPKGDWGIITGRPKCDARETHDWIRREFRSNPPLRLFHGNDEVTRSEGYKVSVLKAHPEIKVFVESCPKQARYIKEECPLLTVITLADAVATTLAGLLPHEETDKQFVSYEALQDDFIRMIRYRTLNENWFPTTLVAVGRGGLTLGHMVARELRMKLEVMIPQADGSIVYTGTNPNNIALGERRYLVIDDLLAKGRTYDLVMRTLHGYDGTKAPDDCNEVKFAVYVEDYEAPHLPNVWSCVRQSKWIVFPWEDFVSTRAGDHGLFRDGTSDIANK